MILPARKIIFITTLLGSLAHAPTLQADPRCEVAPFTPFLEKMSIPIGSFIPQAVQCVRALCPKEKMKEQEALKAKLSPQQRGQVEDALRKLLQTEASAEWRSYAEEKNAWVRDMSSRLGQIPEGSARIAANLRLAESVHGLIADPALPKKSDEPEPLYQMRVLKFGFPKLNAQERNRALQAFIEKRNLQRAFSQLPESRKLNSYLSADDRSKTLRDLTKTITTKIHALIQLDPDYAQSSSPIRVLIENNPLILRTTEDTPLSLQESEQLYTTLESAFIATEARLESKSYEALSNPPPPLRKLLTYDDLENTPAEGTGYLGIQVNNCVATLVGLAANRPTKSQNDEALKNVETSRRLISDKIGDLLSPATSDSMRKRIARARYLPAPVVENFASDLQHLISQNTQRLEAERNVAKSIRDARKTDHELAAGYDLSYFYEGRTLDRIMPCRDHESALAKNLVARDQVHFSREQIELSGEYVHSPGMTLDVALHEFSHLADPANPSGATKILVSNESMGVRRKIAACLASQFNQKLPASYLEAQNDEDFADLGQALLPPQYTLSNCTEFQDLETSLPIGFDLTISPQNHAPAFFRLLHIENLRRRGNLPDECKTVIRHRDLQWQFKDCRDPAVYNVTPTPSRRNGRVTISP